MARKLRMFQKQAGEVSDQVSKDHANELRTRLDNFPFVQLLAGNHHRLMWSLLGIMVICTIIAFPLWLLLWAQDRFLPFDSIQVTRTQCATVAADGLLVAVLCWPALVSHENVSDKKAGNGAKICRQPKWYRFLIIILVLPISASIIMVVYFEDTFTLDLREEC
jgi:hypothetical protein